MSTPTLPERRCTPRPTRSEHPTNDPFTKSNRDLVGLDNDLDRGTLILAEPGVIV
jgi:hypothetical protein